MPPMVPGWGGGNERLKPGDLAGGGAVAVTSAAMPFIIVLGILHARFQQIDDGFLAAVLKLLKAADGHPQPRSGG